MKSLRSLFATLSCTAFIVGIGLPGISETLKNIQVQSQSNGIENKEYGNKQSIPSIVGNWKSSVDDNEYRQTNPTEINLDIKSDGSTTYAFNSKNGDNFQNNAYKYSDNNGATGTLVQELSYGSTTVSSIKWISENEFVQTLISDSRDPHRNGIQRRYIRQQEPVATILQEKAQQAAARREQNNGLRDAQIQYDGVNSTWPQFWNSF